MVQPASTQVSISLLRSVLVQIQVAFVKLQVDLGNVVKTQRSFEHLSGSS